MDIPASDKVGQADALDKKSLFPQADGKLLVTQENAAMLTVHFLSHIYARLGYVIKLLEKKDL